MGEASLTWCGVSGKRRLRGLCLHRQATTLEDSTLLESDVLARLRTCLLILGFRSLALGVNAVLLHAGAVSRST